jgi:carboxymethylenebutenolidase
MAREESVVVPLGDGRMQATLALPDPAPMGGSPGVIVIHEILGLNDDIRRIARRFAGSGYAALAPDLFDGLGPKPICIARTIREYRRGGGRALEALEAARAFLAARPEVDGARIGVAGFCMGGGFALLLGRRPEVGAAAAFYGEVPGDLGGVCPVVAGYGARDRVFGENGHLLEQRLRELGVAHDVVTYPDAGHSFMSRYEGWTERLARLGPLHAGHHEPSAEDSWRRMLAFFAEHLDGRSRA